MLAIGEPYSIIRFSALLKPVVAVSGVALNISCGGTRFIMCIVTLLGVYRGVAVD